jgi:hypothetical protein
MRSVVFAVSSRLSSVRLRVLTGFSEPCRRVNICHTALLYLIYSVSSFPYISETEDSSESISV